MTQDAVHSIMTSELPCTYKILLIDNDSGPEMEEWGQNREEAGKKHIIDDFEYFRNSPSKSVSASWNQGIKRAFEDPECEYIAVLNNDIILHPKTLKHLMAFMDKTHYLMVTGDNIKGRMSKETMLQMELPEQFSDYDCWPIEGWRAEGPDFSCYMINRETIRVIGWFDENFLKAYCEDQDFHARSMMARTHAKQHNDQGIDPEFIHFKRLSTAPYYHYASQTIGKNPGIARAVTEQHGRNQEYYRRKYGGDHPFVMDGHGYKQPFGDATKNWRDW